MCFAFIYDIMPFVICERYDVMIGTLINAAAIIIGSLIGWLLKRWINAELEITIMHILGAITIIIGLNGLLTAMITSDTAGVLHSHNELLLLGSMVGGAFVGEKLKIEQRINQWGAKLEKKFAIDNFTQGFISATVIFCVGAMTIVGSMNDGLYGDYSMLLMKSGMDFIASMILCASLGISVMASAISVLCIQGGISLLAPLLEPVFTIELMNLISMVGYGIVFIIGLNFIGVKNIKTANLLPALIVPIIYYFIF